MHLYHDPRQFNAEYVNALKKTELLPRKLACLTLYRKNHNQRYEIVVEYLNSTTKAGALQQIPEIIGRDIDLSFFSQLDELRSARNKEQIMSGWTLALTTFETLIQGYKKIILLSKSK